MKHHLFAAAIVAFAATFASAIESGAPAPERFWLASKFDGRRAVIYFDTLRFGNSFPATAEALYPAAGFGIPSLLPEPYVARMQNRPGAVHFGIGDKYDIVVDGNLVRSATITKLVGWIGDEGVGNESYIGAIVNLDRPEIPLSQDWFVARRHIEIPPGPHTSMSPPHAQLLKEPVPFDIQTQIASIMKQRMRMMADPPVRAAAEKVAPAFTVQSFSLADGRIRYYVRCEWHVGKGFLFGAWLAPQPALHIVGVERRTASYGFETDLPNLLNVLDLGDGRTAIVLSSSGEDSEYLGLLEYHDGGWHKMHQLQAMSAGE
jgi:hypothetical protein